MEQSDIAQTAVHYLSSNYGNFIGTMPKGGIFLVESRVDSNDYRGNSRVVIGTPIDVIAELIETGHFFGSWVTDQVSQSNNPHNAKISRVKPGDEICVRFKPGLRDNYLILSPDVVSKRSYLDYLRNAAGFVKSARLLGIKGDLEIIASRIFA